MTASPHPALGRSSSVALVVLFLAFVGVVIAKETGQIDGVMAKRGVGALLGLIMVVTGNFLPKLIFPLNRAAPVGAAERLCGWILVLTGLALVAAFVILPDAGVALQGALIGLAGFAGVGLTLITSGGSAPRDAAADRAEPAGISPVAQRSARARVSAIFILHAIAWALAMFVADAIWDDPAAIWMVIGFTIANSLLALALRKHWRPVG
ncbi:hypothetical protein [uncultured Brevundimonas sp.]|uniref:hypothetical protein n=1 Tax=uncultured Brevundimonas sp. TaxID=213418 RepID=UPI0030EE5019|tara:strand:- start:136 stop:762 length:627 start_codon:yes stop_codon:yes gene_type:complete